MPRNSVFITMLLGVFLAVSPAWTADILMYGPSIGGAPNEAMIATADGHTVTVDGAIAWGLRSTASFATFDALVIGDLGCVENTGPLAVAEATAATWGAAVTGNVVSYAFDPTFGGNHGTPQSHTLIENAVNFAASGGGTGLVMSLGCYYLFAPVGTPVVSLGGLGIGPILVSGQATLGLCNGVSFDDPGHPVLAGLTPGVIGNTGCSVHAVFDVPLPDQCVSIARSTGADQPWIIVCELVREITIDIKFCSNPNAFNCRSRGKTPVTIFGEDDFDVNDIVISTLQLCLADLSTCVGPPTSDGSIADRGDPTTDPGAASCVPDEDFLNPDGFDDLDVAFDSQEVSAMIGCGSLDRGEASGSLIVVGQTTGGMAFQSTPVGNQGIDQLVKKH